MTTLAWVEQKSLSNACDNLRVYAMSPNLARIVGQELKGLGINYIRHGFFPTMFVVSMETQSSSMQILFPHLHGILEDLVGGTYKKYS